MPIGVKLRQEFEEFGWGLKRLDRKMCVEVIKIYFKVQFYALKWVDNVC